MKKYLMTSTVYFEVKDGVNIFEAMECGEANITDSRMTMVDLDTAEIIVDNLDLKEVVDFEKLKELGV